MNALFKKITQIVNENILRIMDARGAVVLGLRRCQGRQRDLGLKLFSRGGAQVKNHIFEKKWVHPDALQSKQDLIRNAVTQKP